MGRPRIRTIKPEIWDSEDFNTLTADGQLAFIALVTQADDEGRQKTNPHHLWLAVFHGQHPGQEAIAAAFEQMESRKMIQTYQVDGSSYVWLVNWLKHQRIEKPKPSEHPAPPEGKALGGKARAENASRKDTGQFTSALPAGKALVPASPEIGIQIPDVSPTGPRTRTRTRISTRYSPDGEEGNGVADGLDAFLQNGIRTGDEKPVADVIRCLRSRGKYDASKDDVEAVLAESSLDATELLAKLERMRLDQWAGQTAKALLNYAALSGQDIARRVQGET